MSDNSKELTRMWSIQETRRAILEVQALQWDRGYSEERVEHINFLKAKLSTLLEDPPLAPVRPVSDYPHKGWYAKS